MPMDYMEKWRNFRERNDFWDVVDQIGWKEACAKWIASNRKGDGPTTTLKAKVNAITGGDKDIKNELHEIAVKYREALADWVESYSYRKYGDHYAFPNNSGTVAVSDDGWWDLRAHIVGCGREAYLKAMTDPESIAKDYAGKNEYIENFEYLFS